ncbi:hypothetical protein DRE43_28395 [Salmonella enterica subsp. enterica serovar Java]|uniref:Uncharacterized protein n=1 Tax=Salmonella enterica subsp. enterica serovar Java TaxID=224729 RepID=A0A3Y9C5W2_SALEB|nr:hypothetical protein [Salmonella enterica subsp. enterica serovar Java]EAN8328433.1 hypothetical protein [Salmonella enterica]EBR9315198.1 hypothetical protein [Salmonella enterica subsp. enterica serovar Muenchen]EBU8673368.1 hypothetical protein [Salmonella enterica subsp. enterica serovar Panama]EBV3722214.1 hypothetical protein [Salmonella enterica subsp. enterica serovar Oranienburg]EBV8394946.1 hypothetical protein [Salmonella enterica subsp. enterica serovar Virchow]EBZ2009417.1 hyp
MKIHYFSLLPLCVAAVFPAYAFKSTVQQTASDLRLHEDQLLSKFYSATHEDMQNLPVGTCGVTPVPGCQCAWCSALRNAG